MYKKQCEYIEMYIYMGHQYIWWYSIQGKNKWATSLIRIKKIPPVQLSQSLMLEEFCLWGEQGKRYLIEGAIMGLSRNLPLGKFPWIHKNDPNKESKQ